MKVVMYHYIRNYSKELPFLKYLNYEDFKKQLDYFQKKFGFINKQDFIDTFSGTKIPKGIVLTFDDGLIEHYSYVFPELLKRKLWGIFYIPYNADKRKNLLGPHRIHLLLGKYGGQIILKELSKMVTEEMLSHKHVSDFRIQTYKDLSDNSSSTEVKRILNYYIGEQYREETLNNLMNLFFKNEESFSKTFYMNKKQIKEMFDAGMIIGAHTVNHPVMSKLDYVQQEKEITPCFKYIENITKDKSLRTYCHPYGGSYSFNSDTISILEKLGCSFSFSVESRNVSLDDVRKQVQSLPRYDCNLFSYGKIRTQN